MKKIMMFVAVLFTVPTIQAQNITTSFTTNGIAPIPSFTLGEAATTTVITADINKYIAIQPDFAFSLRTGKPWYSDVFIFYKIKIDSTNRLKVGFDYSLFFQKYGNVTQTVVYPTFEANIEHSVDKDNKIIGDMWYMYSVPSKYGTKGTYVSIAYQRNVDYKNFSVRITPNLFYLNFFDDSKGLMGSVDVSINHKKTGLFIGIQSVVPVTVSNVYNISKGLYIGISKKLY